MGVRWTHLTLPVSDLTDATQFFIHLCGLQCVRDRREEGGRTVWLGPAPAAPDGKPGFVLVLEQAEVKAPLDHLGFQCDTREEVEAIGRWAQSTGRLLAGPRDAGGSVGYYVLVQGPSGHSVEFTHGQPIEGLPAAPINSAIAA